MIDTSSVLEVRRIIHPAARRPTIYSRLDHLVESDLLVFPDQVYHELRRYTNPDADPPDLPFAWADRNRAHATRHATDYDHLQAVLAKVPEVLDPDKSGVDEADPYVLALAMQLQHGGHTPIVVTQEVQDRPDKMSMTTACGILRIHRLPLDAFLRERGLSD